MYIRIIELLELFEYLTSNMFTVNNSNIRIFEYWNIRISVFDAIIPIIIKCFVLLENFFIYFFLFLNCTIYKYFIFTISTNDI
jgi:hypothetical protein